MPEIYVQCRTKPFNEGSVVDGVVVTLNDANTGALIATATSGDGAQPDGTSFLGDRAAGTYEIRLSPPAGTILQGASIQKIEVVAAPATQYFDVYMDPSTLPTAPDANFCRCSGHFVDGTGQAARNVTIRLLDSGTPQLLYNSAQDKATVVIPKTISVKTDAAGYASVDLVKGQNYSVFLEGYDNTSWTVQVPDASAAPLADVVLPVVDGVEYTYNNVLLDVNNPAISLNVGEEAEVGLETVFRSGVRVKGLTAVSLESKDSDQDFFSVSLEETSLKIKATAVTAATNIEVSRVEPEDGYGTEIFPEPTLRGKLAVTVVAP